MKKAPFVSIVMPVFNSQKTLVETVNSVISQSYSNWELVCVDDGSSDESISIIRSLAQTEPRIRFFTRTRLPKGGSTCRNIGAQSANGEYLIFLDSDDLLSPTCIEQRVQAICGTENEFVVFPMATFKDGDFDHITQPHNIHIKDYDYLFASAISAWQITSPIFRKDFFLGLGGFDERFPRLQDIEFHLRAITKSNGKHLVEYKSNADCFYRLTPSGYSAEKLRTTCVAYKLFLSLLIDIVDGGGFQNKYKLSHSMLLLFSNISLIKYTLWKKGEDISYWSTVLDRRIESHINKSSWMKIQFLNRTYSSRISAIMNFYMGRVLLHTSMHSFKTRF